QARQRAENGTPLSRPWRNSVQPRGSAPPRVDPHLKAPARARAGGERIHPLQSQVSVRQLTAATKVQAEPSSEPTRSTNRCPNSPPCFRGMELRSCNAATSFSSPPTHL